MYSIPLERDVLPEPESKVVESSGRLTFTLIKKEPGVRWTRLLVKEFAKPKNMGIWWELAEKYNDDFPDVDYDTTEEDSKQKKKKPKKKS